LKQEYERMAKYTKQLEKRVELLESKLDILLDLEMGSLGKSEVSI
jgi:hypothetical protein